MKNISFIQMSAHVEHPYSLSSTAFKQSWFSILESLSLLITLLFQTFLRHSEPWMASYLDTHFLKPGLQGADGAPRCDWRPHICLFYWYSRPHLISYKNLGQHHLPKLLSLKGTTSNSFKSIIKSGDCSGHIGSLKEKWGEGLGI